MFGREAEIMGKKLRGQQQEQRGVSEKELLRPLLGRLQELALCFGSSAQLVNSLQEERGGEVWDTAARWDRVGNAPLSFCIA